MIFPEPFPGKLRCNFSVNWNFREQYSGKFWNYRTGFQNLLVYGEKSPLRIDPEFQNHGTFSIMEMEKNSG